MFSLNRTMPVIGVTDYHALSRLAFVALANNFDVGPELNERLENCWVVADDQVSPVTVRLGSSVSYDVNGDRRHITLVLPDKVDAGHLSVLTPVGVALIGLRPGERREWHSRAGRKCQLTVTSVGHTDSGWLASKTISSRIKLRRL